MQYKTSANVDLSSRALRSFLGIAFGLGTLTQLAAVHAGLRNGGEVWLWLTMWVPAVAALSASRSTRRAAWAAVCKPAWHWLGPAFALGCAPTLMKTLLLSLSGTGHWNSDNVPLTSDGRAVQGIEHVGTVLGFGTQSFPFFSLNLLISIALGSAMTAIFGGIGEELGWRGVLQPAMEQRFGPLKGTFAVGLIWAYWHLPANLWGYNDARHPVAGALWFFPLGVVALSFALAWITRRSGSVWPAALLHGANNTIQTFVLQPNGWKSEVTCELLGYLVVGSIFLVPLLLKGAGRAPDRVLEVAGEAQPS